MKSYKIFLMSVAVVLFAAGACNKESNDDSGNSDNTGAETTASVIVLDSEVVEVGTLSTTVSVDYSITNAVEGETLSFAVEEEWLDVTVEDSSIEVTVQTNTDKEERSATVVLSYSGASDVSLTVTQIVPVIVVDSEVSVSSEGGETTVSFSVTNAVENDEVTATPDYEVVTEATVDQTASTVTLTIAENTESGSRSGKVTLSSTYAKDVEISVVQSEPYQAAYSEFIGTWTVTDTNGTSASITISQNVEGSSYTVSGWQFNGRYSDFTGAGFDASGSLDFTATYDSDSKALIFSTVDFGANSMSSLYSGNIWLLGTISSGNVETYVDPTNGYTIATMRLTDATNARITGESVLYNGDYYDITSMQYYFLVTSPWTTQIYWDNTLYFPCTFVKSN